MGRWYRPTLVSRYDADVSQGWLFTVEEWQTPASAGDQWTLWTEPPLDSATGLWRRRRDGNPYTPAWGTGDVIVMYHPESQRCVALLDVVSEPDWRGGEELFWLDTRVRVWNERNGPKLADIGVERALQGGRHRLTPAQLARAERAFGGVGR